MPFRVIIAGGRDYTDYENVKRCCDNILSNKTDIEVVSGRCDRGTLTFTTSTNTKVFGVDGLGERYAQDRHYKVNPYPADWDRHGAKAAFIRNSQMAWNAEALIAFWDGISKGTAMMIKIAKDRGLPVRVVKYKPVIEESSKLCAPKSAIHEAIDEAIAADKLTKKQKRKKHAVNLPEWCTERYLQAHKEWFYKKFPNVVKDQGYLPTDKPVIDSANAVSSFIGDYLFWRGHRSTRVNVMGRMVNGKWIKSSTRTGSADRSSTINGRSCMFEIKFGKDTPSPDQLKEQKRERAAGGVYEFVYSIEEFFNIYDKILLDGVIKSTTII